MARIKQYKKIKKIFKPKVIQLALKFKNYKLNNAIIIFSEARGGSTWLMELLKNIPEAIINWEPLHATNGVVPKKLELGWRPYLPVNNKEKKYISLFSKILRFQIYNNWTTRYVYFIDFKRSKYVLTKFVRANLCLPWVVNTFPNLKHRPIHLLRHPITTCISRLKTFEKITSENISTIKNDIRFKLPGCINNERFALHKDYINTLKTKLEVEIAIWCINNVHIIHHKNAIKWYTLYYEDLVLYPEQTFQAVLHGIDIQLSQDIIKNISYRKASGSNYHGDLKSSPKEQLESFLKLFNKEELNGIQAIFDYFGLKIYSAFNAYPIKGKMDSKQVLISIIIPTFNRAHLIGETLDSVLAQTYQNWECIVVDDGSTDNTEVLMAEYMAKDSRFQYHHRPTDRLAGGNAARNYGFKVSNGEFIQWFDSDDLMFENYLKKRINIIKTQEGVDVVFCAFTYFNEKGLQNRTSNKYFSGNIIKDIIDGKILLGPQAYMLRRGILQDCKFDEKLKRAQDADFFFRLFTKSVNLKILHTSDVLYMVRKHQNAISSLDDSDGLKLNSRFIVHKRILKYFYDNKCFRGIHRYKTECLLDLKRLLDNKNYIIVSYNIINFEYLTFRQKSYFLFCIFTEFSIGRGANQFKNR